MCACFPFPPRPVPTLPPTPCHTQFFRFLEKGWKRPEIRIPFPSLISLGREPSEPQYRPWAFPCVTVSRPAFSLCHSFAGSFSSPVAGSLGAPAFSNCHGVFNFPRFRGLPWSPGIFDSSQFRRLSVKPLSLAPLEPQRFRFVTVSLALSHAPCRWLPWSPGAFHLSRFRGLPWSPGVFHLSRFRWLSFEPPVAGSLGAPAFSICHDFAGSLGAPAF